MTPEIWAQVSEAHEKLEGLPPEERPGFLESLSSEVRAEVEKLLDGTILYPPLIERAPVVEELPCQLGSCEITEKIGEGGMGEVLRGIDRRFSRSLAVKILRKEYQEHPEVFRRFESEAHITARLQHPGIPPVYEMGHHTDGRPWFSMKLVDGCTLDEELARRKDPSDRLPHFLNVFTQICQTVAYAHSQGVLHRDLKPSNVMVGAFGEVQVMDWGLAKVLHDPDASHKDSGVTPADVPGSGLQDSGSAKTQVGQVMGTLSYMAPEQAAGMNDRVDERTDVYSLGVILYEILAGTVPFTGNYEAILQQIQTEEPKPPHEIHPGSPFALELMALKALAKSPEDRWQSAMELAEAVGTWQDYRQIADNIPLTVWAAGPDGAFDYLNARGVKDHLGEGGEFVPGDSTLPFIHTDDLERTQERFERAMQTGEDYEIEQRILVSQRGYRWYLTRGAAQWDSEGNVIRLFGTSTDIHDLKVSQEKLAETEAKLQMCQEELNLLRWFSGGFGSRRKVQSRVLFRPVVQRTDGQQTDPSKKWMQLSSRWGEVSLRTALEQDCGDI